MKPTKKLNSRNISELEFWGVVRLLSIDKSPFWTKIFLIKRNFLELKIELISAVDYGLEVRTNRIFLEFYKFKTIKWAYDHVNSKSNDRLKPQNEYFGAAVRTIHFHRDRTRLTSKWTQVCPQPLYVLNPSTSSSRTPQQSLKYGLRSLSTWILVENSQKYQSQNEPNQNKLKTLSTWVSNKKWLKLRF